MKKLILLFGALFLLTGAVSRGDELGALKIYKARLPIYHKKRLQLMIFCAVMTRKADQIFAEDAVIDILKKDIDLNQIKYLEDTKPYPLGTIPAKVAEFWKDKTFSHGFIYSSAAIIQQESKVASGNEKVFFRSPQLDLNGVGFTANFDSRIIKVLENVDILIRANPYKKDEKGKKDSIVKAKSDSMIINMEKELVTLIGNVKVDEASFDILCDRLELDLKKNKQGEKGKAAESSDDGLDPSGVSQITCIGNVKITRKLSAAEIKENGSQKAFADRAVYKTAEEKIILTGKNPQIYRGSDMISGEKIVLWKESERLEVFKNCLVKMTDPKDPKKKETELNSDFIDFDYANNLGVFTGHVRVKNADFKLNCDKMTIHLEDREKKNLMKSLIAASGKKDLKEIVCTGDVVITRSNSARDEKAVAENAVYVLRENKIILSGNSPLIISGRDSVSGKKMLIWLDQNRLEVAQNSKVVIGQDNISRKAAGGETTVTSDSSDLNYGGNELSFSGRVKVDNPRMNLVCDNLKIFLDEPKKPEKPPETGMSLISPGGSGGKDVNRIVCTGSVRADDPRATLNCDRMVITFRDRPAGQKTVANFGGLGGGGGKREVDLIKCFGNVYMLNKPEDPKAAPATLSSNDAVLNIPENVADLLGNVKIEDPRFQLTCNKMKLLAKDITPARAAANAAENQANFNTVPEHIAIGDTKELTKIICLEKVVMVRKLPEELQRACGDKAVYEVSEHTVTLTGNQSKPTLQRGPTVMEGEKIILWTDNERLDIKDGTLKNFDSEGLNSEE